MGTLEEHHVATGDERVVSTVTRRVEIALPATGTREWWVLYLLAPVVLVGAALLAFPTLVYDRFVWRYLRCRDVAAVAGGTQRRNGGDPEVLHRQIATSPPGSQDSVTQLCAPIASSVIEFLAYRIRTKVSRSLCLAYRQVMRTWQS